MNQPGPIHKWRNVWRRWVSIMALSSIPTRLIVNRISAEMVKKGDMLSKEDVIDILALELLGAVPMDDAIVSATNKGVPATLEGGSAAARAYDNVARRLTGEVVEDVPENVGFFARIGRAFGFSTAA